MAELVLEPLEVESGRRWRWLLRAEDGPAIASHEVALTGDSYEDGAFVDLYRFLRWEADPARRVVSEAELTARVGEWIGRHVLGEAVMTALLDAAPVTVRMPVPATLPFLPYRPWEIAAYGGRNLGREQVRFVFDLASRRAPVVTAAEDAADRPIRVLALFSLPEGGSVLGLRRERYALQQLVHEISHGGESRAVQLRTLQYGVTREALAEAVDDADGWDVLHISGHGGAGMLLLEAADGSADPVHGDALVDILFPMRHRLRLAVLSACESGAATAAEMLKMLDLSELADALDVKATEEAVAGVGEEGEATFSGLARTLVERLGCAVVAMRYPVVDDFAIEFAGHLYRGLFQRGQPVDTAVARALVRAAGATPSLAAPAISIATPAVLDSGVGLRVQPPVGGAPRVSVALAGFPSEPPRFVGRTAMLAQARTALMRGSGKSAVVLHGMAGAGKTTAAVELAYQTVGTFTAAAYWTAPSEGQWHAALAAVAQALEAQLNPALDPDERGRGPALQLVGNTGSDALLQAYLPRLTELLEQSRMLIVLDNLENLLTPSGAWLDPRFGRFVEALTNHTGGSRVVMTSRIPPTALDAARTAALPLNTLTRDESLLLARELPNLRALQHDTEPPTRTASLTRDDRALLLRTLRIVQGHPKLLEFADAAAADRTALEQRVAAAEAAAEERGMPLAAFLSNGESDAAPDELMSSLAEWTRIATAGLQPAELFLLRFLAGLEPDDRQSWLLGSTWSGLWAQLGHDDGVPDTAGLIATLTSSALVEPVPVRPDIPDRFTYRIHPGVADTVRQETPREFLDAVDKLMGAFWGFVFENALEGEQEAATGWAVVTAAFNAVPYLMRMTCWRDAGMMLEQALHRDVSPASVARALPYIETIVEASSAEGEDLASEALLADVTALVDTADGERRARSVLERAIASQDYRLASTVAASLSNLLFGAGRLVGALSFADRGAEFAKLAGLGEWTQLSHQAHRLQILLATGEPERVLTETEQLRERVQQLEDVQADNETVDGWNVREALLDTAREAALALFRWREAVAISKEIFDSATRRGAPPVDLAMIEFNSYGPLLRLQQIDAVDALLRRCQETFEAAGDPFATGIVLSARADVADERGHRDAAIALERTALRYKYAARPSPESVGVSHFNLANYLCDAPGQSDAALAHRIAATLLSRLTGMNAELRIIALSRELTRSGGDVGRFNRIDDVRVTVEEFDGVRFGAMLDMLEPDAARQQEALDEVLAAAAVVDYPGEELVAQALELWAPVIRGVVAVANGTDAPQAMIGLLDSFADHADWSELVTALRRVMAGERDSSALMDRLDPIDAAIMTCLLEALPAV